MVTEPLTTSSATESDPLTAVSTVDKVVTHNDDIQLAIVKLSITASVKLTDPAEKFPEASRSTIVFAVFADVAVVAELATLPAVEIVANFVSTIAAVGDTSAFTIKELDNKPEALL